MSTLADKPNYLARVFDLPSHAAKLLPSLERLIAWRETNRFSEYGFEGITVTDVTARGLPSEIDRMLNAFNHLCKPAPTDFAAQKLTELRLMTAHRAKEDGDTELMAAAYTTRLAQYPADVIAAACDAWSNANQWWPTWAELKNECEKRMQGRSQIHAALVSAHLKPAPGGSRPRPAEGR